MGPLPSRRTRSYDINNTAPLPRPRALYCPPRVRLPFPLKFLPHAIRGSHSRPGRRMGLSTPSGALYAHLYVGTLYVGTASMWALMQLCGNDTRSVARPPQLAMTTRLHRNSL